MKIKFIVFSIVAVILFLGFFYYLHWQSKNTKANSDDVFIYGDKLTERRLLASNQVNKFSFYNQDQSNPYSYFSQVNSLGLKAFTGKNLKFSQNSGTSVVLPAQTINQMVLKTKQTDTTGAQHFFYQQTINDVPVYGAHVNLHLNSSQQIYGFDGNVTVDDQLPSALISIEQAQAIALDAAQQTIGPGIPLEVYQAERYVFNKKILGLSDDDHNYLTLAVTIKAAEGTNVVFGKKYFVDFVTGQIIGEEELMIQALNREIKRCNAVGSGCSNIRTEGQPVTGNQAADETYDILGLAYNFYFQSFNRDSYDNNGTKLVAVVNFNYQCPNAFADATSGWLYFCNGMTTADIVSHELTHLVTGNRLIYSRQSGAMNESISDIFATGVDTDDWQMGDGSILGVARYLDDPPRGNQPDRLFSNKYYCQNQDNGGVHFNGGVLSKAFYLMAVGGSFNSCSIQPVGKDKTFQVVYRALMTYISPTANFRNMYEAIDHACTDLYGQNSSDCLNVRRAMQATEMDQQPAGSQIAPICNHSQGQPPTCLNNQSPTPTSSVPTPTNTPPNLTPTLPVITPTSPPITPAGNTELNLKLKFQGIDQQPKTDLNQLRAKVTLVSQTGDTQSNYGTFVANDKGIWTGKVYFNLNQGVNTKYKLLIKGTKHIQKRICDALPTEEKEGYYQCETPNTSLTIGVNQLDFSGIYLLTGDLADQDGIINSYDLSLIRERLGGTSTDDVEKADLNLDGVVNTQDYSLVIFALSTRFDE